MPTLSPTYPHLFTLVICALKFETCERRIQNAKRTHAMIEIFGRAKYFGYICLLESLSDFLHPSWKRIFGFIYAVEGLGGVSIFTIALTLVNGIVYKVRRGSFQ